MIQKDELKEGFVKNYGSGSEPELFFAPGRVNIIGEHLDYNGGYVFPAAIGMGISASVRRNSSTSIRMRSADFPGEILIDMNSPILYNSERGWGNYPAGVISRLISLGVNVSGCDIYFAGDLPGGSGLSSSACIEVLTGCLIAPDYTQSEESRVDLASLCRSVENEFIGVNCGIMDQFAVAMGRREHAILLDTEKLDYTYVPFKIRDYSLVIINTNRPRKLAESAFNQRRDECMRAVKMISESKLIENLAAAEPDDINLITDPVLKKRARHVVTENIRVKKSVSLLSDGNMGEFGALMTESHDSLREDYEVTGPELDSLVTASLSFNECAGARMTGAGFGGCAIALVKSDFLNDFVNGVGVRYFSETGLKADFYPTIVSDGVGRLI